MTDQTPDSPADPNSDLHDAVSPDVRVSDIRELRSQDGDDEPEDEADEEAGTGEDGARLGPSKVHPHEVDEKRLKDVLESLVFVADQPVSAVRLAKLARTRVAHVRRVLAELLEEYHGRGVQLIEVGGGYQFRSAPRNAEFVRNLIAHRPVRLTRAQLETLSIVAYRQPVTRPEIDEIRGVDSGSALKVLLERNLLKLLGRKEEPGRPLLYGTTPQFLEFFGLSSLRDLPTLREFSELNEESRALFERRMGEPLDLSEELDVAAGAKGLAEEFLDGGVRESADFTDDGVTAQTADDDWDADREDERDESDEEE